MTGQVRTGKPTAAVSVGIVEGGRADTDFGGPVRRHPAPTTNPDNRGSLVRFGSDAAPSREVAPVSKVVEDSPEDVLDIVLEYVIVILIGIPICLILMVVALASCLICLPFFVPMAPHLFFTYRRRKHAMCHPLSDWSLGVLDTSVAPATGCPCPA